MASWNAFCATIFSAGSVTSRAALARASNCRARSSAESGRPPGIDLLLGRRRQGIGARMQLRSQPGLAPLGVKGGHGGGIWRPK